jgi:hypothetical protein
MLKKLLNNDMDLISWWRVERSNASGMRACLADLRHWKPVSTYERVYANVYQELWDRLWSPGSRGHILTKICPPVDLGPVHTARTTQHFLAESWAPVDWEPYSPD